VWQQILKAELASQSGYAQLDFDNIVEEEDDTCRKRWLQLREKVENWAKENCSEFTAKKFNRGFNPDRDELNDFYQRLFVKGKTPLTNKRGVVIGEIEAEYNPNFPEEIYCKALDVLSVKNADVVIGDYEIYRRNYDQMDVISIWQRGVSSIAIGIYFYDDASEVVVNPEIIKTLRQKFEGVLQ